MSYLEDLISEIAIMQNHDASGHDFHHTMRVYNNAQKILIDYPEANQEIVLLGSLMHDIADHKFGFNDNDRQEIITKMLHKYQVNNDIINRVIYIANHISFKSGTNKTVFTQLEDQIVQDADRLDAIGAIAIARTFAYGGFIGHSIYEPDPNSPHKDSISHFYEKLLSLKDNMHTKTAKQIATKRHEYMENYLQQFYQEWNGEK